MKSTIFILIYITLTIRDLSGYQRSKFKAAVYEHEVILPEFSNKTVSRQEALSLMHKNLDIYKQQAKLASKKNVDILVFPEDGIYGMRFRKRKHVAPYLEYIPDPKKEKWNPCTESGKYDNTEVQHTLSCLARNSSLYLVANMGDKQPCSSETDPDCPSDGQYQYNTDVVYDPNGTLVARYHKENLYFEFQFNKPKTVDYSIFDTPFGKFGVFTCFDILFQKPPLPLVEKYDVGNIVFPTAWMDALPLLAAIEFHSSFAVSMGVNFLAANIHMPEKRFQGSGIYTPDVGFTFYYNNSVKSGGRLLISETDVVRKPPARRELSETVDKRWKQTISHHEFQSEVFHDLFNLVEVTGTSGSRAVCHNKLCCSLEYSKDDSAASLYAFGAFDGLHTYNGLFYFQTCTLLRCANSSRSSCGSKTFEADAKFQSLRIEGNFSTPYVFPTVLLSEQGQLKLAPKQWEFKRRVLESTQAFQHPLISANLIGRAYDRDYNTGSDSRGRFLSGWGLLVFVLTSAFLFFRI